MCRTTVFRMEPVTVSVIKEQKYTYRFHKMQALVFSSDLAATAYNTTGPEKPFLLPLYILLYIHPYYIGSIFS